jgi:GntR family transcriptional regulator
VEKTALKISDWQLDPQSDEPLHMQLEKQIKQQIARGLWLPGDKIPSEREFMELANISRATIRQALMSLVHQRLLKKVHGSGTYIASTMYEQPMRGAYSFSEQFRQQGQSLTDTVLQQTVEIATPEQAERLAIMPGTEVVVIERLRLLVGQPLMVSMALVPLSLCPDLASQVLTGSLYRLLMERYKLPTIRAIDKLEAVGADKRLASLLRIRQGTPLMYVERLAYTTDNRPLHLGQNYIRGDMCRFSVDLESGQVSTMELKEQS